MSESEAVERAVRCLGRGFDVTYDFMAKCCKGKERLVLLNEEDTRDLAVPGFGSVHGVSVDIKSDKGERIRYHSDVLEFGQMSEMLNRRSALAGKIPSGFFNSVFQFNRGWAHDSAQTKSLALNGYFISLFNLRIDRPSFVLADHVVDAVPSSWEPAALARFIENYGTHIIVGLSMGGHDVVFAKQDQSSSLPFAQIKDHLDRLGDLLFTGTCTCTLPTLHLKTMDDSQKFLDLACSLDWPEDHKDDSIASSPSGSLSVASPSAHDVSFRSPLFPSSSFDSDAVMDESINGSSARILHNELEEIASLQWLASSFAETTRSSCASAAESPIPVTPRAVSPVGWSESGITVICSKRGGDTSASSHCEWLPTVSTMPDVINFTFVPITSLLRGVKGLAYLYHAINLYLRYKPPISKLEYFLDFQIAGAWAPILNDLPLGPSSNRSLPRPALLFSLMGPKLYVNTAQVVVGRRPVTGMRLHLEGMKNNRLAVHLRHLSNVPAFFGDHMDSRLLWRGSEEVADDRYHKPVQWKRFSHVCTAPVKYDPWWSASGGGPSAFIVTGAQLHVKTTHEYWSALHLRLLYSEVPGCVVQQSAWEWALPRLSQRLDLFSTIGARIHFTAEREKPPPVLNSAQYPTGPPVPVQTKRLLKFVDTVELCRGPQDCPGYWLVTGARLDVHKGKIGLHVKFCLLNPFC